MLQLAMKNIMSLFSGTRIKHFRINANRDGYCIVDAVIDRLLDDYVESRFQGKTTTKSSLSYSVKIESFKYMGLFAVIRSQQPASFNYGLNIKQRLPDSDEGFV